MRKKIFPTALLGITLSLLHSCEIDRSANGLLEPAYSSIKIGGSAEVYVVLELLSDAYTAEVDGVEFDFLPPSQTSGGIEGVKNEALDIGTVSRDLAAAGLGEQLTYLPLVQTPLVLIVHDSVTGVTNVSTKQIQSIYRGDITNWRELGGPDAAITLFDVAEDENEKRVLRQAYLGADLAITPEAIVFPEDDELLETAAITDFSLAAVPLEESLKDLPITILSIDGVTPSIENLQSGAYPMNLLLGIVFSQGLSATGQSFVEFVMSLEAQQILTDSNYIIVRAPE